MFGRLRAVAAAWGVHHSRLVFVPMVSRRSNLDRYSRTVDVFVDTHLCTAHSTASDALWSGVPLLTLASPTFQVEQRAPNSLVALMSRLSQGHVVVDWAAVIVFACFEFTGVMLYVGAGSSVVVGARSCVQGLGSCACCSHAQGWCCCLRGQLPGVGVAKCFVLSCVFVAQEYTDVALQVLHRTGMLAQVRQLTIAATGRWSMSEPESGDTPAPYSRGGVGSLFDYRKKTSHLQRAYDVMWDIRVLQLGDRATSSGDRVGSCTARTLPADELQECSVSPSASCSPHWRRFHAVVNPEGR